MAFRFPIAVSIVSLMLPMLATQVAAQGAESKVPVIDRCTVVAFRDIEIPAQDAGLLVELDVRRGSRLSEGEGFGRIDDTEAAAKHLVAQHAAESAKLQAESKIPVDYAEKAAKVAEANLAKAKQANERSPGSVPEMEQLQRKLEYDRALAQIDQETLNQQLAGFDAQARTVEAEAAAQAVARRQLVAPFECEVVELQRYANEWVQQGEPIVRIQQFNQMLVQGHVDARKFDRGDIRNRRVTVEYQAAGKTLEFEGVITYVSSTVDGVTNRFQVEATVQNRMEERPVAAPARVLRPHDDSHRPLMAMTKA